METSLARLEFTRFTFDLLVGMESDLLSMIRTGPDERRILALLQSARSIADSASLFELDRVRGLADAIERLMGEVARGRLRPDASLLNTLLEGVGMLEGVVLGKGAGGKESETERRMLELLERSIDGQEANEATDPEGEPDIRRGTQAWHISCRFDRNCLKRGLDPLSPLHQLERFGIIERLELVDDTLPPLPALDPELIHLGFEIRFRSLTSRQRIEDVFAYFREGSDIRLIPPGSTVEAYVKLLEDLPRPPTRLGEILVACGAVTRFELDRALSRQQEHPDASEPLGRILAADQAVPKVVIDAALERQRVLRDRLAPDDHLLKVEPGKLDALVDQIGELVTASAAACLLVSGRGDAAGAEALETMARLVESVRDTALGLRMIPIGEVFQRFPELVREVSERTGKKVELAFGGAEAELDKSLADRLADPLERLVRQAIEHGIETEAERIAAGKPAHGTIRFAARRESGILVVEVAHDGAGLCEALLERAVARRPVAPDAPLSDKQATETASPPGTSDAAADSDTFCRDQEVGAIRKSVEALRGEIEVESSPENGATFRLRVPLTLSIIDGFRFLVGKTSYVVPLDSIQECADLPPGGGEAGVVRLRNEPLPFVRLRELFAISGAPPSRESLVVVQQGTLRIGLVVDQLAGELQTVVKPLGTLFHGLQAVGGTAILGDGSVALVLDVPHLGRIAGRKPGAERTSLASVQKSITALELK